MLITKFNKMIRSRILWGIFAIIVSGSFVGVSLKTGGCSARPENSVGSISGKPVSFDELAEAKRFELRLRNTGSLSDSELDQLDEAAWKRLATLKYAEQIGVKCTQAEIDSLITSDPRFQVNGQFDPLKYEQIIQQELRVPTAVLEKYMAQEIILNRLMSLAGTMALTPPSEMAQKLERLTDKVQAEYAFVTNNIDHEKIKVSDSEIEQYFKDNIDLFRIPEQISVKYITFPVSDYTSGVTVTEQDSKDYYEENISDYSSRDEKDELVTIPYSNVADRIKTDLVWQESTDLARDAATTIVMDLMPDRDGNAASLEEILKKNNLKLNTSEFFSMMDPVKNIDAGNEFNRAAFSLVPSDPERRISDPVVGSSNVYIVIAGEKKDDRLPALEEVRSEVVPFAKRSKASKAFEEQARNLYSQLLAGLAKGSEFKDLMKKEKIEVFSTEPFSVYSDMTNEVEYSETLIPAVLKLEAGETSDLIPAEDGYMIVHLKNRERGDILSAELLKPQLTSAVSKYRSSVIYYELQDHLLKNTVIRKDTRQQQTAEY